MKESRLNLRISNNRLNKLRLYAKVREKTMTQIVEDWLDSLYHEDIKQNLLNVFPESKK